MPAPTKQEQHEAAAAQEKSVQQRENIQNAYAALLGDQSNQTFHAFTLEEAMDAQIERISGESTRVRPSSLDRVERIKNQLLQTIDQVKSVDPSEFVLRDNSTDVNTDPDGG